MPACGKNCTGTDFCGEPTADCLWQALYEMGIYANLAVEPGCDPAVYPSPEDAVTEFSGRMNCTTPEQVDILREYFRRTLKKTEKGYIVDGRALGAHIWWNARTSDRKILKLSPSTRKSQAIATTDKCISPGDKDHYILTRKT